MTQTPTRLERRISTAARLLAVGLLTELLSLSWAHPTAFLFFMIVGGVFLLLGMSLYLYSVVSAPLPAGEDVSLKEDAGAH